MSNIYFSHALKKELSLSDSLALKATSSTGSSLLSRWGLVIIMGGVVVTLYGLLFIYEMPILSASVAGGWSFVIPVTIAFMFSYAHGDFTSRFWTACGLVPKKTPPTPAPEED